MVSRDGIWCPTCGTDSRVVDTRPHKKGRTRRRECENGHRFSTLETIIAAKPKTVKPPAGKRRVKNLDLPLTYLTAGQKVRARKFFEAGWPLKDVAPLFDMSVREMKL